MIVQRRGKNVALVGAVVQMVLSAVMLAIWLTTDSESAMACTWFLATGVLLWLMAGLLFYCRQMERREALEVEQIAAGGTSTIFERQGADMRPAAHRVKFMERWIATGFTLLFAAAQVTIALFMIRYLRTQSAQALENTVPGLIFTALAAFVGFLFSRYSVGMSERGEWRLLRATGSYQTVNVVAMAAVAGALLCVYLAVTSPSGSSAALYQVDLVAAYAIQAIQILLAVELLLNFILDLYRPRIPGQEDRFSFDSRLFNLAAQPGRVGHSLAEAINYQFGFEVSKSWFYQLVMRAFVPLLAFGALLLVGLSSVVIVETGEQYVITHWGHFDRVEPAGIHFKWPWPIDQADRYETDRVQQILLGVGAPRKAEDRRSAMVEKGWVVRELYLWKEDHGPVEERDFVVAAPVRTQDSPGMNLIKLVVNVQYKVRPGELRNYLQYTDPLKMMESLASREMVRYCAAATLDTPVGKGEEDRPEAIMTYGRAKAGAGLQKRIQKAADDLDLGVDVLYVGFQAVHPPKQVVPEDEKVLEAERRMAMTRYEAQADANRMLAEVAGDTDSARKLAMAIRKLNELESLRDLARSGDLAPKLSDAMRRIRDDVKTMEKEIDQERLLGRVNVELSAVSQAADSTQWTLQQRMLNGYLSYQEQLAALQALIGKPAEFQVSLDAKIAAAGNEADTLFRHALGDPATRIAQAQSARWRQELAERAAAEVFEQNLQAYQASPRVYMQDRWLDVWDAVMPRMVKYVLAVDRDKLEIRMNWEMTKGMMSGIDFTPAPLPTK